MIHYENLLGPSVLDMNLVLYEILSSLLIRLKIDNTDEF
jgi:hypothetical protein